MTPVIEIIKHKHIPMIFFKHFFNFDVFSSFGILNSVDTSLLTRYRKQISIISAHKQDAKANPTQNPPDIV